MPGEFLVSSSCRLDGLIGTWAWTWCRRIDRWRISLSESLFFVSETRSPSNVIYFNQDNILILFISLKGWLDNGCRNLIIPNRWPIIFPQRFLQMKQEIIISILWSSRKRMMILDIRNNRSNLPMILYCILLIQGKEILILNNWIILCHIIFILIVISHLFFIYLLSHLFFIYLFYLSMIIISIINL